MPSYQKLINGLSDLGIQKMQEHLDSYIELVNKGEMSFTTALEELVEIEKKNGTAVIRAYADERIKAEIVCGDVKKEFTGSAEITVPV